MIGLLRNGRLARAASELSKPSTVARAGKKVIDIEEMLIWTYQVQVADKVSRQVSRGLRPAGYGMGTISRIVEEAALGVRVDCGGAPALSAALHPDAEAVHDAVRSMDATLIGLLIERAKIGDRPEWMPGGAGSPKPVRRANGKPAMEYWDHARTKPAYCLVVYDPEPQEVVFRRRVYVMWWNGLAALAGRLGEMVEHVVTAPSAPREPWLQHRA